MEHLIQLEYGLLLIFNTYSIELKHAMLLVFLFLATVSDIKSRRIPNWLVITGSIIAIFYQPDAPYHINILYSLGGFTVGLIAFLPLYVLRAMGAGDVKLMAMVGGFLGPSSAFAAVLITLIAGGILAAATALLNRSTRRVIENLRLIMLHAMVNISTNNKITGSLPAMTGKFPYAISITTGTVTHLLLLRSGHAIIS